MENPRNRPSRKRGPRRKPNDQKDSGGRLTPEVIVTIVAYIKGGSFDHVAAEAAGVSARAFREWVARGEGRSKRPSSPEYRDFAEKVRKAKAEARVIAEAEVHRAKPLAWLTHAAPSKDGEQGWSKQASAIDLSTMTFDELQEVIAAAEAFNLANDPDKTIPQCAAATCRCIFHRPRSEREQRRLRKLYGGEK